MRGNGRGRGGMLNQINRTLERSNDSSLHRVRGNGRVGGRGQNQMKGGRQNNNRARNMGNNMGMQGNMGMNMSPENQMQLFSMLEEQARMMAQFMPAGFTPPAINPAFQNGPQQGRSLFDRVERQGQRGGAKFNKRGQGQHHQNTDTDMDMDTDEANPNNTCKFNLRCTRKDCAFAHQSPAAPEGTSIDVTDVCSFGAACKNRKCTGRHPSPAVRSAHQAEEMCRFFPHCTNPHCHFKHPSMPLCRNGADCKTEGCQFTHLQTPCKFNPCMNPSCPYKHAEGQRGQIPDKVWKATHVSERKFVDEEDGPEELIKPEATDASQNQELTA
ncbi:hypothetical protein N7470_000408 [Penicillium chermesinum]|nr:hypothetical protein N7470_000408 [Penicillium chermesinum]